MAVATPTPGPRRDGYYATGRAAARPIRQAFPGAIASAGPRAGRKGVDSTEIERPDGIPLCADQWGLPPLCPMRRWPCAGPDFKPVKWRVRAVSIAVGAAALIITLAALIPRWARLAEMGVW